MTNIKNLTSKVFTFDIIVHLDFDILFVHPEEYEAIFVLQKLFHWAN